MLTFIFSCSKNITIDEDNNKNGEIDFQTETIKFILDSNDAKEIKSHYLNIERKNIAIEIVYFSMLIDLIPSEEYNIGLLSSIPKTQTEFDLFYSLSDSILYEKYSLLSHYIYGYFNTCARIMHESPEYYETFFKLSNFIDGEIAELYP
ncbi:hypothetical protein KAJ26_07940, partial [bacterium]|nr:hypothetical protein [bacterium]